MKKKSVLQNVIFFFDLKEGYGDKFLKEYRSLIYVGARTAETGSAQRILITRDLLPALHKAAIYICGR